MPRSLFPRALEQSPANEKAEPIFKSVGPRSSHTTACSASQKHPPCSLNSFTPAPHALANVKLPVLSVTPSPRKIILCSPSHKTENRPASGSVGVGEGKGPLTPEPPALSARPRPSFSQRYDSPNNANENWRGTSPRRTFWCNKGAASKKGTGRGGKETCASKRTSQRMRRGRAKSALSW